MMRLREHVHQLLANRPRRVTYDKLSADTGIPTAWLASFVAQRIDNVCADKLQTLYEYLTKDTTRLNF